MRPIKLEIYGLHSFAEKQTIDFDSLSSHGIFGIFGKTGSGKSTILDAITLALYGKVNRSRVKTDFVNLKTKQAEVCLTFECLQDGFLKTFEILRTFKLKKNGKDVDTFATLAECVDGSRLAVCEGPYNVDAKVLKLVGLNFDEFCKCIALPQGEFANFLKSKPNERIELIGNIFGLDEYGNPLYEKIRDKVDILEKEQAVLLGKKEALGEVCERDVETIKSDITFQNAKLNALNIALDNEKKEISKLEMVEAKAKDKNHIENKLKENKFEVPKIERLKMDLVVFDSNKDYVKLFEKQTALKEDKEKFLQDKKECFDNLQSIKFELEQKRKMIESVSKKYEKEVVNNALLGQKCIDAEENDFKLKAYDIQIEKLQKDIAEYQNQLKTSEKTAKGLIGKNNLLENEKNSIEQQLKDIEDFNDEQNTLLTSQIELIKNFEQKIESLKIDEQADIETVSKQIAQFSTELKNNVLDYEKACRGLDVMSGEDIETKILSCKTKQLELENVKYVLGLLDSDIHKKQVEIDARKNNIETLDRKRDEIKLNLEKCEKEYIEISKAISKFEDKKEAYLGEHFFELLVQDVKIGEDCPVCKNKVIQKKVCTHSDMNSLYEEQRDLKAKKNQIENLRIKIQSEICTLGARIEFENGQIELNKKLILKLQNQKDLTLKQYVDINEEKNENFAKILEKNQNLMQNLQKFVEIGKNIDNKKIKNNTELEKYSAIISAKKQFVELLMNIQKQLLSEVAEKEICLTNVEETSLEQIAERKKQKKELENKLEDVAQSLDENVKKQNAEKLVETELANKLVNANDKLVNLNIDKDKLIKMIPEEFDGFAEFKKYVDSLVDEEKRDKLAKESLQTEILNLEESLREKQNLFELINQKLEFVESGLKEVAENLKEKDVDVCIKSLKTLIKTEEEATEARKKISAFETEMNVLARDLKEIEGLIASTGYNEDLFKNVKTNFEMKQKEKEELIICIAKQEENLKNVQKNIENIAIYAKKLENVENKLKIAKELKDLVRGKQLEQFVAEEFIDYITNIASEKLQTLFEGRYDFVCENNEFVVVDNFNNGEKRSVLTLSGGELFVVSLSLALAISESIIALSNKSFDFFFLDEGFGSLDDELCDSVVDALNKLQKEHITIGVISHVAELKDRITNKIEIEKTEKGSIVKYSFDY